MSPPPVFSQEWPRRGRCYGRPCRQLPETASSFSSPERIFFSNCPQRTRGKTSIFLSGLSLLFIQQESEAKNGKSYGAGLRAGFSRLQGGIFRFLPKKGARLPPHRRWPPRGLPAIYVPALMSSPETLFIASGRSHFRNHSPWSFERSLEPSGKSRF